MIYAMKVKSILIILILIPSFIQAQSEQLQREIRIAEGILQELFAGEQASGHTIIGVRSSRVVSDYIPGYGIHFQIGESFWWSGPLQLSREIRVIQRDGSHISDRPDKDSDETSEERKQVTEQKMIEYFTRYAPQLQNLPDNEFVRISTGLRPQQNIFIISSSEERRGRTIPMVTKWVQKQDLRRFSEGSITEQQLIQRIQTADITETPEKRDFNIFKTILDTSTNNAGLEYLRFQSTPYTYLPGFGVQFHLNASQRGATFIGMDFEPYVIKNLNFDFDTTKNLDLAIDIQRNVTGSNPERFKFNADSLRWMAGRSLDSLRIVMDDLAVSLSNALPIDAGQPEDGVMTSEKEKIYDEIIQTIKEYGPTLSSLPDGEFLNIAITWPSRSTELPQRTYIRIKKQDLMAGRTPEIQEIERR